MNTNFHLGKLIRKELDQQQRTVKWFAQQINCERSTCYYIFDRKYIDIPLLEKISIALNHNFCNELAEYIENIIKNNVQNYSIQVSKNIQ